MTQTSGSPEFPGRFSHGIFYENIFLGKNARRINICKLEPSKLHNSYRPCKLTTYSLLPNVRINIVGHNPLLVICERWSR